MDSLIILFSESCLFLLKGDIELEGREDVEYLGLEESVIEFSPFEVFTRLALMFESFKFPWPLYSLNFRFWSASYFHVKLTKIIS